MRSTDAARRRPPTAPAHERDRHRRDIAHALAGRGPATATFFHFATQDATPPCQGAGDGACGRCGSFTSFVPLSAGIDHQAATARSSRSAALAAQ
jgi:hypothetical protein